MFRKDARGIPALYGDAISTYSLLTVGDGLVSQIPALLISVATGILVTRSASDGDLGSASSAGDAPRFTIVLSRRLQ